MSDHVKDIDDESVIEVICKTNIDCFNKRAVLGVLLQSEKEFDKVIINENINISMRKESRILSIVYGLQQVLNVAKQYTTKYKQITVYTGVYVFAKRKLRNEYLLQFNGSYKKDFNELIYHLKPI